MYAHKIADLYTRIGYSKKNRAMASLNNKNPEIIGDFVRQQRGLDKKLHFLWAHWWSFDINTKRQESQNFAETKHISALTMHTSIYLWVIYQRPCYQKINHYPSIKRNNPKPQIKNLIIVSPSLKSSHLLWTWSARTHTPRVCFQGIKATDGQTDGWKEVTKDAHLSCWSSAITVGIRSPSGPMSLNAKEQLACQDKTERNPESYTTQ